MEVIEPCHSRGLSGPVGTQEIEKLLRFQIEEKKKFFKTLPPRSKAIVPSLVEMEIKMSEAFVNKDINNKVPHRAGLN